MTEPAASTETTAAPPAPESAAPVPVARSIGERLRAGRDRSGLSIAAAAEKLHLDPKVIEALEADRFAEMGASVYVRGHLKRYGDFVGEPGAELVTMYSTRETRAKAPDLTQVPQPGKRSDPRRLVNPMIVLGCAAALLAAIWWVLSGSQAMNKQAPTARATPASAEASPELAARVAATPAALTTATPVALDTAPAGGAEATPAATVAAAVPVKETAAREIRLRLELTNDSWVEVYDSGGQRLFYDVATGGSVQSVSGRGPLRVVLENAAGVSVQVDGQPREIPAGAVEGERARFVVNRSGSLSRSR